MARRKQMKQLKITKQKQQDKRYSVVPITNLKGCVKTMISTFVCCFFVCVIVLCVTAPLQMINTTQKQTTSTECYVEETQETRFIKLDMTVQLQKYKTKDNNQTQKATYYNTKR